MNKPNRDPNLISKRIETCFCDICARETSHVISKHHAEKEGVKVVKVSGQCIKCRNEWGTNRLPSLAK